ncbi:MAG: hypothetical protein PUC33_08795 [Oscillospiraceae bacterium]|nr:hypothetical protein [Oscillospiraceae bacterium]
MSDFAATSQPMRDKKKTVNISESSLSVQSVILPAQRNFRAKTQEADHPILYRPKTKNISYEKGIIFFHRRGKNIYLLTLDLREDILYYI